MDFDGNLQVLTHPLGGLIAVTLRHNWLLSQGGDDAKIWKGRWQIGKERDAPKETWHAAFWKGG